jgi:hypothetical protein
VLERELGANARSIGCIIVLLNSEAIIHSCESLQKVLAFFLWNSPSLWGFCLGWTVGARPDWRTVGHW